MDLLWSRIYDVILKTLACGEHYVLQAMKKNGMYRLNCFEVFGFDILLDSDLKPWLIEVNLSPSLSPDSPLDMTIKTNLITDTFNMCSIKRFDRRKESLNKLKFRSKTSGNFQTTGTGLGKAKAYATNTSFAGSIPMPTQNSAELFIPNFQINPQVEAVIDKLSSQYENEYSNGELAEAMKNSCHLKFRDIITETVHEFNRKGNFVRIYPARNSKMYDKYFGGSKALNKIIYKTFYSNEILGYTRTQAEQSANPIQSKNQILKGGPPGSQKGSRDGLHSAGGYRVRQSKSNTKLLSDENTPIDSQSSPQNAQNQ